MAQVWTLQLQHPEQSILLALADHGHDDGTSCRPGVDYLAWKSGYSERQVQRILSGLRETGLIEAVAYESGGRGWATEYLLHLDRATPKPPFEKSTTKRRASQRVTSTSQKGDTTVPKGDVATAPQPEEPPLEPSPPTPRKRGAPNTSRKRTRERHEQELLLEWPHVDGPDAGRARFDVLVKGLHQLSLDRRATRLLASLHPHGVSDGTLALGGPPAHIAYIRERFTNALEACAGMPVVLVGCQLDN